MLLVSHENQANIVEAFNSIQVFHLEEILITNILNKGLI